MDMFIIVTLLVIDIILFGIYKPKNQDFKWVDPVPGSGFFYLYKNKIK